jgi:zinc transport system permease protein
MAALAALAGMVAVTAGLALSWHLDTPGGPSIVVTAMALFVATQSAAGLRTLWSER